MKKIVFLTGTRADFGKIKPLISILEKQKVDKDIELDENTSLLLELSVRKEIINDTRGKVYKIFGIKPESDEPVNDISWLF